MDMKTISTTILIALLLPTLVGAQDDPVAITLPVSGFVETAEAQNLTVAGTIDKGFWENPISRYGGTIVIYASAGGNQVSKQLENVTPILNPRDKIIGYSFSVSLNVDELRSTATLPLKVSVEARNHRGELEDYDEVWGTIEFVYKVPLAVTLSQNTSLSTTYEKGSTDNRFTVITFSTEGALENVGINELTLTRNGGTDDDLLNIKVFDGATIIGWISPFTNGRATITGMSLVIPKGGSKTLTIKADIDLNANTYNIETGIAIGIASASDIKTIGAESASAVTIGGQFPIIGNRVGIQ